MTSSRSPREPRRGSPESAVQQPAATDAANASVDLRRDPVTASGAPSLVALVASIRGGARPDGVTDAHGPAEGRVGNDAQAGAVAVLVERLQPTLARCLRGRLPDVDADVMADLLQEAALHVLDGAASCRATTDEQVRSWACVVAIRAGLAFLRSPRSGQGETRRALSAEAAAARTRLWAEWAADQDPPDVGALRVLARLAADAQAALPPDAAALVWDRVIEDVSWAEAAERYGTTAPGAKRRFQRAQRAIRRFIWSHATELPEPARSAVITRLRALVDPGEVSDAPATGSRPALP